MLTKIIGAPFTGERAAKQVLTKFRKRHRVALRGAVVLQDYSGAWYVHAPLGGTGFSAAEMAGALLAVRAE
jgi:hypothetical protein